MLRVLFLASAMRPGGGPAGYLYNLRDALSCESYSHSITFTGTVTHDRVPAVTQASPTRGARVKSFMRGPVQHAQILVDRSRSELRRSIDNVDLVIIHGYQGPGLIRYLRRSGKRIGYMPHSPVPMAVEAAALQGREPWCMSHDHLSMLRLERELLWTADLVVAPSSNALAGYEPFFPGVTQLPHLRFVMSGLDVPGPGIDTEEYSNSSPLVLFGGRYTAHKGYDLFCEAARSVLSADAGVRLQSMGTGPLADAKYAHVEDLGWRPDVHGVLAKADIVCLPNRVAYFDLFAIESAAMGKALVVSDIGGGRDMLRLFPDAVPCDPTKESLTEAILLAVQRWRGGRTYGKQNMVAYAAHCSAASMAAGWLGLLDELETLWPHL
jgi:glycosyltransferase involved in cell wall biosynthesis